MTRYAGRNLDLVNGMLGEACPRDLLLALIADLPAETQWSIDQDGDRIVTRILIGKQP